MEASQIQHGEPRRLVMSAPTPLRQDFDAPQVRGLARKAKDGPQARRLLALAAIYDGATRTEAAKIGGVGLHIIRDWVLRSNGRGPDGLLDGKPTTRRHWLMRAAEACAMADGIEDQVAKQMMLSIAASYDRLAARAERKEAMKNPV